MFYLTFDNFDINVIVSTKKKSEVMCKASDINVNKNSKNRDNGARKSHSSKRRSVLKQFHPIF